MHSFLGIEALLNKDPKQTIKLFMWHEILMKFSMLFTLLYLFDADFSHNKF
jgi:hypothetical protein